MDYGATGISPPSPKNAVLKGLPLPACDRAEIQDLGNIANVQKGETTLWSKRHWDNLCVCFLALIGSNH